MISRIEVLNFRCLRYIRQSLGRFHVLVGPNASGKTTFLDVIGFVSDLVSEGLDYAVGKRTTNFRDLVWGREEKGFEIALEAPIPDECRGLLAEENQRFNTIRYELGISSDAETGETVIAAEQGFLTITTPPELSQKALFPSPEARLSRNGVDTKKLFGYQSGHENHRYPFTDPRARG